MIAAAPFWSPTLLNAYGLPDRQAIAPLHVHTRQYVIQVLSACRGNKSQAARLLGISRRKLYRWLGAAEPGTGPTAVAPDSSEIGFRAETSLAAIFDLDQWLTAPPLSKIAYSEIQSWFRAARVPGRVGDREAVAIALSLAAHVVRNHPTGRFARCSGLLRRVRVASWSLQLERLHTVDAIAWADIRRVVLWSQQHEHWRRVVLGGDALRSSWDALVRAMAAEHQAGAHEHQARAQEQR